jgi:uncharacterized Zn-finger protein
MDTQPQATEIVHVQSSTVSCDGGVGPLGHPLVYLRITNAQVTCPYCSKLFVLEEGAADSGH